jgi:acyl carrier protein
MDNSIEKITIETVLESASIKLGNAAGITVDTRFHELGIDSITMLSILLKLEKRMSLNLNLLGDQLDAPSNVGELINIVELLHKAQDNSKQTINESSSESI